MTDTQAKSGITGTSMNHVTRDDLDGEQPDASADHVIGRASVTSSTAPSTETEDWKAGGMTQSLDPSRESDSPSSSPESETTSSDGATATHSTGASSPNAGPFAASADHQTAVSETGRNVAEASRVATDVRSPATAAGRPAAVGRSAAPPASAMPATGAARVADAVRSARATVTSAAQRGPRRARLFVKRIDPWSVMKFAFALSFVLFFVLIVATSVLYLALDSMHVFTSVNKALADFGNIKITAGVVIGASGAIGLVMVVLCTALSTLSAFIYNVCADLVGGIEVTLSEKE